jgi:hypothetical protein
VKALRSTDDDVQDWEDRSSAVSWGIGPIPPRLTLLLVGGSAMAGIACMCLAVTLLAIWKGA